MKIFRLVCSILACIGYLSCNNSEHISNQANFNANKESRSDSISTGTNLIVNTNTTVILINDSFVNRVLDNDFSYNHIKSLVWQNVGYRLPERNVDTEQFFSDEKNKFTFYKGSENSFLENAVVSNSTFMVDTNIEVGIKKSILGKKLKINSLLSDSVVITESEGYCNFFFIFQKDTLAKILYINNNID